AKSFAPGRLAVSLAAVVAVAVFAAEAVSLLPDVEGRRGPAGVRAGDLPLAPSHAAGAAEIQPRASSPPPPPAPGRDAAGDLVSARAAIGKAVQRDDLDWRTWWVAARIERRLGYETAAARSLTRARTLNPRSPLVSQHT